MKNNINTYNNISIVVARDAYESVFKLAIHMLKNRLYFNIDKRVIKTIRSSKLDPNIPISFSSDTYSTYIAIKNENFIINTTKDIEWDIEGILDNNKCFNIENEFKFWFPEYNIIGSIYRDSNNNPICCHEHNRIEFIEMEDGLKVCPICYWNEFIRFKKNTNTVEKLNLLKEAIKKIDNDFLINLIESKNGQFIWKELKNRLDN